MHASYLKQVYGILSKYLPDIIISLDNMLDKGPEQLGGVLSILNSAGIACFFIHAAEYQTMAMGMLRTLYTNQEDGSYWENKKGEYLKRDGTMIYRDVVKLFAKGFCKDGPKGFVDKTIEIIQGESENLFKLQLKQDKLRQKEDHTYNSEEVPKNIRIAQERALQQFFSLTLEQSQRVFFTYIPFINEVIKIFHPYSAGRFLLYECR